MIGMAMVRWQQRRIRLHLISSDAKPAHNRCFLNKSTEDPDNRGGGGGGGGGVHMRTAHGDVSPEEIFNMFFNGMAGGPGFHVYSTGFGPGGVQFRAGRPFQQQRRQQQGRQAQPDRASGLQLLFQLLPIILIALLSFMSQSDGSESYSGPMPGENKYFSLTVSFIAHLT